MFDDEADKFQRRGPSYGHPRFDVAVALVVVPGIVTAIAAVLRSRLPRFD